MSARLLAEAYGPEIDDISSLWRLLSKSAEQNPHSTALISLYQARDHFSELVVQSKDVDHVAWTYSELQQASTRLAVVLHGHGIRKGSIIACFLWNSVEWVLFCWAAAALNASFAPQDPRSLKHPTELRHRLNNLGADVIVVEDRDAASSLDESSVCTKLKIICQASTELDEWHSLCKMQDTTPFVMDCKANSDYDDVALILQTSGTTSLPKACAYTAKNLNSQSASYQKVKRMDETSKMITHSPFFHIGGFWNSLCAWRAGATLVIPSPRFDADATWRAVVSERCTHLGCTPTIISALLNHPSFEVHRPTTIRFISIGADIVTSDLVERVKNELGSEIVVWSTWGMTEGVSMIAWEKNEDIPSRNGILSIGRVMPGAKIRICGEGTRRPLERCNQGELHCSGTSLIRGYQNQSLGGGFYMEDQTVWFATGDRALMDDDGRIFVIGRYNDHIVRGGVNMSPAGFESCLDHYPGVKVCLLSTR